MSFGFVRATQRGCVLFAVLVAPALGRTPPAKVLAVYVLEIDTNIKGEFAAAAPALTLAVESAFSRRSDVFQVLERRHLDQIVKANQLEKDLQSISHGEPASAQFTRQVHADGFIRGELADGPDGTVLTLTLTRLNSEIVWQGTAKRTRAEWQLQHVQDEEAARLSTDAASRLTPAEPREMPSARPLRLETEGLKQVRTLIGEQPTLDGKPVYCDSVVFSLVLAHTQSANTPIRVNSITVHSEALKDTGLLKPGACEVDRLSSHPYGIRDIETVVLTAEDNGIKAKYIKTATSALEVNPDNILDLPSTSRSITLNPGEEPFGLRIILEDNAGAPRRIWFSADYDANGPQTITSEPVLIWR